MVINELQVFSQIHSVTGEVVGANVVKKVVGTVDGGAVLG